MSEELGTKAEALQFARYWKKEAEQLRAEVKSYQQTLRQEYEKREALDAEVEGWKQKHDQLEAQCLVWNDNAQKSMEELHAEVERLQAAAQTPRKQEPWDQSFPWVDKGEI